jgi:hypothetical protein
VTVSLDEEEDDSDGGGEASSPVQGAGFRVHGSRLRVQGVGCRV